MVQKTIIINEWKSSREEYDSLVEENFNEIDNFLEQQESGKKVIGKFKYRDIFLHKSKIKNNGNSIGILNINENLQLEFRPKIDVEGINDNFWRFLPEMLNKLSDFKDFEERIFLNSENNIELPKGFNMVPLFTLSFVSLCSKAIEMGMYKKYLKKFEDTKSIKGKINFQGLFSKHSWDLTKMPCEFYDLTFDNNENQIILYCAKKLLENTKHIENNYFTKKLRWLYYLMSSEITYLNKDINDFEKINHSAIPPYYQNLMSICKAILNQKLFSFDKNKKSKGINFLIDMEWIFEQYMTKLFEEVIKEEYSNSNIEVESQNIEPLGEKNKIKIKPDLLLKKNDETKLIIDFKWKFKEGKSSNSDYYQVICYGLSELQKNNKKEDIDVALFAVNSGNSEFIREFDTILVPYQNKKIKIKDIRLGLSLFAEENIEEKIKEKIKEEILNKL